MTSSGTGAPSGPEPGGLPPVPDRASIRSSSIGLIVVGVLCGTFLPAVLGIIALVQLEGNPESARSLNRAGWICAAIILALVVLFVLLMLLLPFGGWLSLLIGMNRGHG